MSGISHQRPTTTKMGMEYKVKSKGEHGKPYFKVGDAEDLPFEAGTFDVVVTRHLLWTLPHPDIAVQNWMKVLKKGGVLIVIDGLYNGDWIERNTRQFISDFLTLLVERRYPGRRQYPNEIKNELPNPNGVPPKKTCEYFRKAGFKNVKDLDLKEIAKIQKKKMSFRKRIVFKPQAHLIYGEIISKLLFYRYMKMFIFYNKNAYGILMLVNRFDFSDRL